MSEAAEVAPEAAVGSRFFETSDGSRIHYELLGTGEPTVAVPEGFRLRSAIESRPDLLEGRTWLLYDPRNRGRSGAVSDLSRLSIPIDVADLEELRESLGIERMSVLGLGDYGKVAAMYATERRARVDRLVLLAPTARDPDVVYPGHLRATDRVEVMGRDALAEVQRLQVEGVHESDPREYCEREWAVTRRALVGDPDRSPLPGSPCALEREWPVNLYRHFEQTAIANRGVKPPAELFATLETPVLIVHGTLDRQVPYGAGRQWALELPTARLLTIEGGGHYAFVEQPERLLEAVSIFLGGEWPEDSEPIDRVDPRVEPGEEV